MVAKKAGGRNTPKAGEQGFQKSTAGKKAPKAKPVVAKVVLKTGTTVEVKPVKKAGKNDWLPKGATIKKDAYNGQELVKFHGYSRTLPSNDVRFTPEHNKALRDRAIERIKSEILPIQNMLDLSKKIEENMILDGKTKYGKFNKEIFGLSVRQVVSVFADKVRFEDAQDLAFEHGDPVQKYPSSDPAAGVGKANMFKWLKELQTLTPREVTNVLDGLRFESNLLNWWSGASELNQDGRPLGTSIVPVIPANSDVEADNDSARADHNIRVWIEQLSALSDEELKSQLDKVLCESSMYWWWGNLANFEGKKNRDAFKQSASRLLGGFTEKVRAHQYEDRVYERDQDYSDESNWFWNN